MDQLGHILIADDQATFLQSTADLLRKYGYTCTAVPDASATLECLRQSPYDLLITDIKMAGNVHLELVTEVARIADGMPVILVTGYPEVRTALQALHLPVIAYLVKPFEVEELLAEVRSGVERHSLYRAVCQAQDRAEHSCHTLRDLAGSLATAPKAALTAPLTSFLTLTMHNIINALFDWERLTETFVASKDHGAAVQVAEASLLHQQRGLLEEAVRTLERTKCSFKSKELGELRKRLQDSLKSF